MAKAVPGSVTCAAGAASSAAACPQLVFSCLIRSTEAAASNDGYYIYRLGHYNKISKYLVIIQFESYYKSGSKRATLDSSQLESSIDLPLLPLLVA